MSKIQRYDHGAKHLQDRIYREGGVAPCMTKEFSNSIKVALPKENDLRVRKLTPRECFRLQGFPDDLFERAASVNVDSQLYKQAGNSVTVNVIYEIAKRLKEIENDNYR